MYNKLRAEIRCVRTMIVRFGFLHRRAGLDRGRPQRDRRHRDHRHVSPSCSALMGIAIGPEDPDLPGPISPRRNCSPAIITRVCGLYIRSIPPPSSPRVIARDGRNDTVQSAINHFENCRCNWEEFEFSKCYPCDLLVYTIESDSSSFVTRRNEEFR